MYHRKMEMELVEHGACTLAGIKSASLFNYFYSSRRETERKLAELNEQLNERGVYLEALQWKADSVLIYVYRPAMLNGQITNPGVAWLLDSYGYDTTSLPSCISGLKCRLSGCGCFPHEIGVFLGYPLEDVIGFIKNKGENCECCGAWKVYCNKEEKDKFFQKMKKCKDVYLRVFGEGRGIRQMTVCS